MQVLQTQFGLAAGAPGPAQREIAEHLGLARSEIEQRIAETVGRWRDSRPLGVLRDEVPHYVTQRRWCMNPHATIVASDGHWPEPVA